MLVSQLLLCSRLFYLQKSINFFWTKRGDSASNDSEQIFNLIPKLGYIAIQKYEV